MHPVDQMWGPQAVWGMQSQFGPDDGPNMALSRDQCAFVVGKRGSEKIVVCDVMGSLDVDGDLQIAGVQGICPECNTQFRINPSQTPCEVGNDFVVFMSRTDGPVRYRPLTVYVPMTCTAPVAAVDEANQVIGTGTCSWNAVVRHGRALPIDHVRQVLPMAIEEAKNAWSRAMMTIQQVQAKTGSDYSAWAQAVNNAWQTALPGIQAVQSGQYARSGPASIVGAWDCIDHSIMTCASIMKQAGA